MGGKVSLSSHHRMLIPDGDDAGVACMAGQGALPSVVFIGPGNFSGPDGVKPALLAVNLPRHHGPGSRAALARRGARGDGTPQAAA